MYLVNRTVFFLNGSSASMILEGYNRKEEAAKSCVTHNELISTLLPVKFDTKIGNMSIKDLLMELQIASIDHNVIHVESKSSIIEIPKPIISC